MLRPRIPAICSSRISTSGSLLSARRSLVNSACPRQDQQSKAVIGQTAIPVDDDGIPLKPVYSIKSFLASLPAPSISDEQFIHLHKLAALTPPAVGTSEFRDKKKALEEMVRLVEGVRTTETTSQSDKPARIPDGRVWPEDEGVQIDWEAIVNPHKPDKKASKGADVKKSAASEGSTLFHLASKQVAGYYVVKKRQAADVE